MRRLRVFSLTWVSYASYYFARRNFPVAKRAIETELGRPADAGAVLAQVLAALNRTLSELGAAGPPALFARWLAASPAAHGAPIEWDAGPGTRTGTTAGLAEDGALLARAPDGLHRIVAGEVRWL